MGPKRDVIDIVAELGGIKTLKDAQQIFKDRLDEANLTKRILSGRIYCAKCASLC